MVQEREPPQTPSYPSQEEKKPQKRHIHPEFGKPSPLGSNFYQRHPFNIPKANKPRPEHHRPTAPSQPQHGKFSKSSASLLRPMKPSSFSSYQPVYISDDEDSVAIARPTNEIRTIKRGSSPLFTSPAKPKAPPPSKAASNIQNFVDLTTETSRMSTNNAHRHEEFGAMDAYTYVDAAKANENIKALLEGAFEDEDDKPRTRSRKKKIDNEVMNLADKLQAVSVNDGEKEQPKAVDAATEDEEEEEEDDGTREGLKVKLLPHQIEGVDWMKDKEVGLRKTRGVLPKGGILADDMGLGKTIQTIALLLANPRPPMDETDGKKDKCKPKIASSVGKGTLVVAPLALIKQWESEIESKVAASHRMRVCVYHGQGRTKHAHDLNDYDVVITTYGTLSSEHAQAMKDADGKRTGCFGVHWYRIVLDEAHTIKNRNAKTTQAVYALNSEYRWCLTGTPMQNNLDELQSLIRFLRIKPYDDLAAWRDQITRPLSNGRGGLAIRRLRVYLKAFMKRRTKDVLKQDGALGTGDKTGKDGQSKSSQGFEIKKREVIKVAADFSDAEREFYTRLEKRTDKSLEQMIGRNNLSYASALVLLLRLRQACNHPDLVKGDLAQEKDALSESQSKNSKNDDIDSIADMLGGLSVATKRCDVCQIELSRQEALSGTGRCAECEEDLQQGPLKNMANIKKKRKDKSKSKQRESNASIAGEQEAKKEDAQKARMRKNRPIVLDSDDEDEAEWLVPESERPTEDLGTAGGTDDEDAEGGGEWLGSEDSDTDEDSENEDEDEDEEEEDDSDDSNQVLASTKVRHLMKILRKEADEYKFIVFSVFTSMLDKIEPFLKRANIGYARYDGKMRNDLREASLHKLRNSKNTRVLLCSLRAGSLGLNLTAASRVVILEPFWNPFVEEQAIDRVHRLNQTVDVKIYKLTIKDTVEERILDLQERKRELANATIEGKTAAGKLTMNDMLALFRHDAEARFSDERDLDDLDFSGKSRLLNSKDEKYEGGGASSTASSTSRSNQSRRATPPVMESRNKGKRIVPESSVYGRRW
ncbi:hypothetical protein VTO42DRAFT_1548 [Malbranchea cinnamomea]